MCGIAGFCDFKADYCTSEAEKARQESILEHMRESLAHRGHDQTGAFLRGHVGLSHTRLSIRDLAHGAQPMVRRQNGAEYTIIYNGEVYNTAELTPALRSAGCTFETTCDTEVILNAYLVYGEACAQYLNGIFAFAIWDSARQQLFFARDRLGVKPLFYTRQGSRLLFGSEIKALFAHPAVRPQADLDSFREIFGVGPARTPGCGVFAGIQELQPGFCAVFDADGLHLHPYWELHTRAHTDAYPDTAAHVRWLVEDAVTRQLVSDVPICSFLSGGLDSSLVTTLACNALHAQGAQLNTYSFDFSGNDRYFSANSFQPARDRPYVDEMLKHLQVHHTYLECRERDLVDLLKESTAAKDLPGMADVDASLLYFCRLVKQQNKVALTGECADEIFGGYPWFYRQDLLEGEGFPWARDFFMRKCLLRDDLLRKLELEDYAATQYAEWVQHTPQLEGESPIEAKRRQISYLNLRWFMQTLLDRMDRASMYSGLEARVPFADHRIVEYVYNVPWQMKYRDGTEKALLRDAFRGVLAPELLWRKKSPYPKTYDPHYEAALKARLLEILSAADAPLLMLIDPSKVQHFFEQPAEYGRPWFGQLMAAPQLIAYLIQINDWLTLYQPELRL